MTPGRPHLAISYAQQQLALAAGSARWCPWCMRVRPFHRTQITWWCACGKAAIAQTADDLDWTEAQP